MAWSYRKRIKIIPGIHLNFSKSGISTSIGVRSANVTIGKSGTYINQSIPGLGIYKRQKISGGNGNGKVNQPTNYVPLETIEEEDNIFSADIQEITSQNMQGIKEAILLSHGQRTELKNDLKKVKTTLSGSKLKLTVSYILLYGLIKKNISEGYKADIEAQKDAVEQIQEQIENCYVGLDIDFDEEIKEKYERVVSSFKQLITSIKIWDITSAHSQDTKVTRSAAATLVTKRDVRFDLKAIPEIKTIFEALRFKNINGADIYIYPNFLVLYSSETKFAIIGFDELKFYQSFSRFVETGTVPKDTKVIDRTWFKVNKNGSPDKRFKNNYQIPVVRYGEIGLNTETGLNEVFQFSNYEYTEEFGNAFNDYQATITRLKQL